VRSPKRSLPCVGDITRGRFRSIKSRLELRRIAVYPSAELFDDHGIDSRSEVIV
jgi:hypothetical protein